jgi:TonB-linked SusC/RagA family outer membrane protein
MIVKLDIQSFIPRYFLIAIFFTLLSNNTFGFQSIKEVNGKVLTMQNEPIPGVSIVVKGTNQGTMTDGNGDFRIQVKEDDILICTAIGYLREEALVNQSPLTIVLTEDMIGLDEIVVVGYGEQKRSNLTGAISSVKMNDIENRTQLRIDQALQGMVAGVTVARNGGAPGDKPSIHIRGVGSINGTEPLWIVDGIRMEPGNHFDVDDVESIEVLKDASASAIYGAKAAHGVILVTTKRGKGDFAITFKSSITQRKAVQLPKLLRSEDFVRYKKESRINAGQNPEPSWDNYEHDTDWIEAFYNGSGILQSYDLSIAKGDEKMNYFISFGHDNEDGILIDNNFKRYSLRINSDVRPKKWLKIGESILLSRVTENPIGNNNENYTGGIPYRSIPIMPIYDETNPYGGWGRGPVYFQGPNPVATQYQQHETRNYNRIDGNIYAEISPLTGLKIRGSIGYNFLAYMGDRFEESFNYGSFSDPINRLIYSSANDQALVANAVATYDKKIDAHEVKIMIGYEAFKYDPLQLNITGSQFITKTAASYSLGSGPYNVSNPLQHAQERMLSQFSRINYTFKDRYLLEANIRRDGSSKFGPSKRYGFFPSVSVGWRISEEAFFSNVKYIDALKLRGSIGKLGSDNIANFVYAKNYTSQFSTYSFDRLGNNKVSGFYISKYPNQEVHWEEVNMQNIAIDASAFENRLTLSVDFYNKDTKDLLFGVPIPSSIGIAVHNFNPVNPEINIGTMRNRGVDIELGYNQKFNLLDLRVLGNTTFNKNEMIGLGDDYIIGGSAGGLMGGMTRTEKGKPISSFYGYKVQQMLNTEADVYAINTWAPDGFYQESGTAPGDFMYMDLDGDGEITEADRTFIGNPWPKMTYGINVSLVYNNVWDFSILFQGVQGVDVFNGSKAYSRNFYGDNNTTTDIFDAWTPERPTQHPRNIASDPNQNWSRPSDYFVENGAYLKLRNIQLGYTLSTSLLQKMKIKKFRVYANANNLLTFTKYSGLDPEVAGYNTGRGIDYGQYPQVKSFTAGLEIQF